MSFLFLVGFLLFTANSKADCDASQLRHMNVGEVVAFPSGKFAEGATATVHCKIGHGIEGKDGKINTSFKATCTKEGRFETEKKRCSRMCNVASVFQPSMKVDITASKINGSATIASSKLVPSGSIVKVECLKNHKVKDTENDRSYEYKCGDSQPIVRNCVALPFIFNENPPTSTIEGDYIPRYECAIANLVTPNGIITAVKGEGGGEGKTFAPTVKEGETVTVTCKGGYSAIEGADMIVEKFDVKCDPKGSGKWEGIRACTKRCDVSALLKATGKKGADFVSQNPEILNSKLATTGRVNSKNHNDNKKKYIDVGAKIRVSCTDGNQIRQTFSDYYDTTCIDGTNFSVGNKAPMCEKTITPCKNSEIIVNGLLQDDSLKSKTTNIGAKVAFKCQGDGGNQTGYYFKEGNNSKVPFCEFRDSGESQWSHKTFNCYNGCISNDGKEKVPAGKAERYTKRVAKRIWTNSIGGSERIYKGFFNHYEMYPKSFRGDIIGQLGNNNIPISTLAYEEKNKDYAVVNGSWQPRDYMIGMFLKQENRISVCWSRQTILEKIGIEYRIVKFGIVGVDNNETLAGIGRRHSGHCDEKLGGSSAHNGDACVDKMKRDYGLDGNWKYEKSDEIYAGSKTDGLNAKCNRFMNVPNPNHYNCRGSGNFYSGGACSNWHAYSFFKQEASCGGLNVRNASDERIDGADASKKMLKF